MKVPDRVHVVPLGYEFDRVVEPLLDLKADRAVLVHHTRDSEPPAYHADIRNILQEEGISLEERECDLFDLYTCLGEIAEAITRFEGDNVYVNVATGSKVTAIAGMIACMATGATPYYVSAKEYERRDGEGEVGPVSSGVKSIEKLSGYPIEAPSKDEVRVLKYLSKEAPASKKQIIEFAEENGLDFISDLETDRPQGKYRRLESRVMKDLKAKNYVEHEDRGRTLLVHITEDGEKTLRAFSYLID